VTETYDSKHWLYNRWQNMLQRCENPHHPRYKDYGARGITVCAEWHDFGTYARWIEENLGPPPGPSLTLDRKDNDGPYAPGNMRWADRSMQQRNQRAHGIDPRHERMRKILAQQGRQGCTARYLVRRLITEGMPAPRETVHRWLARDEIADLARRSGSPATWHAILAREQNRLAPGYPVIWKKARDQEDEMAKTPGTAQVRDELVVDDRGRANLQRFRRKEHSQYKVTVSEDGTITLTPLVSVTAADLADLLARAGAGDVA
jgi:hypothetical protein